MRAEEARSIADQKGITIENVISNIKSAAQSGQTIIRYFDVNLSFPVIQELLSLGYLIAETKGQIGDKIITISW